MPDAPIFIDEAYVCDIARNRLGEIRQLIQMVKKRGSPTEDLLLFDHLISVSVLAVEEMAVKPVKPADH
jgi:hypothetical protein